MKLAYVSWIDSTEYSDRESGERANLLEVENAGFLLYEDQDHIELAFYKNHSDGKYEPVLSIPRVCIKTIRILET